MSIESLSALLDGELRPQELERTLAALERDPALRAQFDRLVAARAALQGTKVVPGTAGLADRVRAALDTEPVRVARAPTRRVPRLLWIPLAAAAAATGFAVLAVRPQPEAAPVTGAPVAEAVPAAAGVIPVSMPAEAAPAATAADPKADQGNEQLQSYLMIYSQARADAGAGGSLGFARVASQPAPAADAPATR